MGSIPALENTDLAPKKGERLLLFDAIRTMAMLYIVAVWHVADYLPKPHLRAVSPVYIVLTSACLGLFCFISGFLLTLKYDFADRPGLPDYFSSRFLRIYPLFVLALVLYWCFLKLPTQRLILSGLLVSGLVDDQPGTLWFIENLVVYYAIFPLLSWHRNVLWPIVCTVVLGVVSVTIWPPLLAGVWKLVDGTPGDGFHGVDRRMLLYMVPFVLGIILSRDRRLFTQVRRGILAMTSAITLMAFCFNPWYPPREAGMSVVVQVLLSLSPALWLGDKVSKLPMKRMILVMSYASFCIYLLHRVVYAAALHEFHPRAGMRTRLVLLLLALPLTVAISYALQWAYDLALVRLLKKQSPLTAYVSDKDLSFTAR